MKLRRASVTDAAALALVGAASFLESFADDHPVGAMIDHIAAAHSAASYAALLVDPAVAVWIVEHVAGAPIGYAVLVAPGGDSADAKLERIYMLSRWHGTGFGRALFDAAETEARARGARKLVLSVYTENAKALSFYRARGFIEIGTASFASFPAGFADFIMQKPL